MQTLDDKKEQEQLSLLLFGSNLPKSLAELVRQTSR